MEEGLDPRALNIFLSAGGGLDIFGFFGWGSTDSWKNKLIPLIPQNEKIQMYDFNVRLKFKLH